MTEFEVGKIQRLEKLYLMYADKKNKGQLSNTSDFCEFRASKLFRQEIRDGGKGNVQVVPTLKSVAKLLEIMFSYMHISVRVSYRSQNVKIFVFYET